MARISRLVRGPPFSGAAVAFIGRRIATLLLLAFEVAPPFMDARVIPPTRAISPADFKKWVRKGVKSIAVRRLTWVNPTRDPGPHSASRCAGARANELALCRRASSSFGFNLQPLHVPLRIDF